MSTRPLDIPVSLVGRESISLPLEHGPIHVHVTIPFSFLVKDFDPNTAPVPQVQRPRSWWRPTWLFGRRYEPLTEPASRALILATPYHDHVWQQLSLSLFGKHESMLYCVVGSDIEDWESASVGTLSWAFATGATDDDIDHVRAIVLKANDSLDKEGRIRFTVEEMDETKKAAWKAVWVGMVRYTSRQDGESEVDLAMLNKNSALHRLMASWALRASNEKESLENHSSAFPSLVSEIGIQVLFLA